MPEFVKPVIVVSKCLEFEKCRYNGDVIHDPVITRLQPYVEFVPVCPEVGIGLGVPRDTIRIIEEDGSNKLVQPSTKEDLTEKMNKYSTTFVNHLGGIDGAIMKSKSPTCGMKDVKVYSGAEKSPVIGKTSGFFAQAIMEHYPLITIEEEGRLNNFLIREHFFIKLFTTAEFRKIKEQKQPFKQLLSFHSRNKYLFMAYNQTVQKELGRILASHKTEDLMKLLSNYERQLHRLFARRPRDQTNINVCQHIMGYFKKELTPKEKEYFEEILEKYRFKKLPLSSVTSILKSWAVRFETDYLLNQTYFKPYPEALIEISDSGKGRAY
ncbi:YbgA family protein [Bacillus sp. AK128]